jgi:anti-anti-sigma regulatory factor
LGFAVIDEFRELAVTMKKVGVSAAQCALGFRIATIIIKTGINESCSKYKYAQPGKFVYLLYT